MGRAAGAKAEAAPIEARRATVLYIVVDNGRLAMIAISGMTHHYFLTGKGPVQFITQIPNFRSCAAAAVDTGLCK